MIEAMKQALDALERSVATCFDQYAHQQAMNQPDHFINQSITSLRQAIAEAEKQDGNCQRCGGKGCIACDAKEQPVAWVDSDWHYQLHKKGMVVAHLNKSDVLIGEPQPFYVTPQPRPQTWGGLTNEEKQEITLETPMDAMRMTEAILKERNT